MMWLERVSRQIRSFAITRSPYTVPNEPQQKAIRLALQQQFTVIQGPPGKRTSVQKLLSNGSLNLQSRSSTSSKQESRLETPVKFCRGLSESSHHTVFVKFTSVRERNPPGKFATDLSHPILSVILVR